MTWRERISDHWRVLQDLAPFDPEVFEPFEPNPPALEEEVAHLEHRLGFPLDPSYREFLRTADGWRFFDFFCDLLPVQEITRWVGRAGEDPVWRGKSEFFPAVQESDLLVVARAQETAEVVFLVTTDAPPWPVLWETLELLPDFTTYFNDRASELNALFHRLQGGDPNSAGV